MNILLISLEGDSLGLAMRCREEGHPTYLYIEREDAGMVGEGIVDKTTYRRALRKKSEACIATNVNELLKETKPDLVVFDSLGFGRVADYLREKGIAVFGSSLWSDTVSRDSEYASQIAKRLSLKSTSVKGSVGEYVVLWNGSTICASFLITNETKMMTGSLGEDVESTGNTLLSHSPDGIFEELGEKLEKVLKRVKMRGILSLSYTSSNDALSVSAFNSSLLFLPTILETFKGSVVDFLFSIASGKKFEGEVTFDYSLSILLSIPPYPRRLFSANTFIDGVDEGNLKHLYLLDVYQNGEVYESAGASGRIGWVTARGRDVKEARRRAYKTISNLTIDDIQYRLDIGEGMNGKFNY